MTQWAFPGIYEVHLVTPVHSTRAPYHPSTPKSGDKEWSGDKEKKEDEEKIEGAKNIFFDCRKNKNQIDLGWNKLT